MCCVLGTPLEVWDIENVFRIWEREKAGQCHCETSFKHLGKSKAIREVPGVLEKADLKPAFQKGRKEDWQSYRVARVTWKGDMARHSAAIPRHLKDKKGAAERTWEGKEGDVLYPGFSNASDMLSVDSSKPGC